jgi:hypothetical protein
MSEQETQARMKTPNLIQNSKWVRSEESERTRIDPDRPKAKNLMKFQGPTLKECRSNEHLHDAKFQNAPQP